MASRIFQNYCLVITLLQIACARESLLKLGLGFKTLSPPEVIVQKNSPLLLNCSGYSEAGPLEINWRHQGEPIEDDRKQKLANGSLYIEKVAYQKKHANRDDGNYTCLLKNNFGVLVSRPIRVVIARIARSFTHEPQSLTTHTGGHARFTCQIHAIPPAVTTWFHNGQLLPHNDSRYTLLPSGTLQIAGVTPNDAGNYQCQCTNIARHRLSEKAMLTVLPPLDTFQPPIFISSSESVSALVNNSVVLECLAYSFPKMEISWKTEVGEEVKREHVIDLGISNLLFPSVKPEDSGTYICTATSTNEETGEVIAESRKVSLTVYEPPTFVSIPESHVNPPAQTSRFDCAVIGNPTPSIEWLKNGEPLFINGRIKLKVGNTLVISQTVSSDSGIYQCMASNSFGVRTVAARLQVTPSANQPKPPGGLKAHTFSSTAIQVSWDPAISPSGLAIQAYTVHYLPTSGGLEQQTVAVNTSQMIEKLKPYTNYTFYVRAYNGRSASEQSESIVQMTGEDVPLIAPSMTVTSRSPTTVHLQWNELSPEKARGVITSHRIHYRKHRQASYSVIDVTAGIREYTITGLLPKKKYEIRVMSGTKAGFPVLTEEDWPWTVFEMPDATTAKIPMSPIMHLTVVNMTALDVEWSMPSANSYPVNSFDLSYRRQGHPLQGPIVLPANVTKFLLSKLEPQKWYEVHLVAKNEEGESQESVRNIITFAGDNPNIKTVEVVEPPLHLEAEPKSSRSINLVWKTPETSKNISYYTVRYHKVVANDLVNESFIHYIQSTNTEVSITELEPYTLFAFSVRSHDVYGQQGPFSQKVECRTMEDIPTPPRDITWSRVDANSIRLNWQLPQHPNGMITAYHIMYSVVISDTDLSKWTKKTETGAELTSLLNDLTSNTVYYLCMKAENSAGLSQQTQIIIVKLAMGQNSARTPSQEVSEEQHDPMLGIIVGISIGGSCIIMSAIILIYRNKCCPVEPAQAQPSNGRYSLCCNYSYAPQLNGHASGRDKRPLQTSAQEMDCFTPMLGQIPNGRAAHLDTKGGYPTPMYNGRGNGCAHQIAETPLSGSATQSLAESSKANEHNETVFKPKVRYKSGDCISDCSGWQDYDIASSAILLHEEEDRDTRQIILQTVESSSPEQGDSPHLSEKSARNNESSCNTKTNDYGHPILSHGAVPQHLTSSSDTLPSHTITATDSNAKERAKRNSVPSIPSSGTSHEKGSTSHGSEGGKSHSTKSKDCSSLPYSVNAFLSPLVTPRFSQSSSMHSSVELV